MPGDAWMNKWGMMKLADFRVGMTLREIQLAEIPTGSSQSSERFLTRLRAFRKQILPTDTLYYYNSDPSQWEIGFGSEGYALVRDGELFGTLV
jgi:hypothetical protein